MKNSIYTSEHKKLVKKLKQARLESGLDQEEVAKLLGKTQSFLSKIESGQRRIDIIVLKEFSRIYDKPIDFFIK